MRNYAIIPARAGSKSIVNKNLCKVGGKGLADRVISVAKEYNFSKVILTTDIELLLEDYACDKSITLLPRQPELCTDSASMQDVVWDAIVRNNIEDNSRVWLLQPTTPFRDVHDFNFAERLMAETESKSLISVKDVGDNHPNRMYRMYNSELIAIQHTNFKR